MSNHATLSYSGRLPIETNSDGTLPQTEKDRLHTLLDDAIAAYEGGSVSMETAVVHFEREGDTVGGNNMPRAHADLKARGALSDLTTLEDTLAKQIVGIGLEPDTQSAKNAIQIE